MTDNIFTSLIIAAAGSGTRMNNKIEKPFIPLKGTPIVIHTILAASKIECINEIILIISEGKEELTNKMLADYNLTGKVKITTGGKRRQDSVKNGFLSADKKSDIILIHDGARPFLNYEITKNGIKTSYSYGVSIPVVPVKPTIKKISADGFVKETINRAEIAEVQTPQCFQYDILKKCLDDNTKDVTDEATLAETMGFKIKTFAGFNENIKITTPEDIIFAEQIINFMEKNNE